MEDTNGTYINLLYDLYGPTLAAANLGYVGVECVVEEGGRVQGCGGVVEECSG